MTPTQGTGESPLETAPLLRTVYNLSPLSLDGHIYRSAFPTGPNVLGLLDKLGPGKQTEPESVNASSIVVTLTLWPNAVVWS